MTGDELRALRGEMSQSEFASWLNLELGMSYRSRRISDWERNDREIPCEVRLFFAERRIAELEGKK